MILLDKETGQEYETITHRYNFGRDCMIEVKPISKPKPVDMSVLIGSGIDCIFGDADDTYTVTCTLREVKDQHGGQMYRSQLDWYIHCNPRMNYWFSCNNWEALEYDLLTENLQIAGFALEGNDNSFKIIGLKDGVCWPWECDV